MGGVPMLGAQVHQVQHSIGQLNVAVAHVQSSFRDTFPSSLPEIPGAAESSQRAALVGDTLIRTAGIVELSVS